MQRETRDGEKQRGEKCGNMHHLFISTIFVFKFPPKCGGPVYSGSMHSLYVYRFCLSILLYYSILRHNSESLAILFNVVVVFFP